MSALQFIFLRDHHRLISPWAYEPFTLPVRYLYDIWRGVALTKSED